MSPVWSYMLLTDQPPTDSNSKLWTKPKKPTTGRFWWVKTGRQDLRGELKFWTRDQPRLSFVLLSIIVPIRVAVWCGKLKHREPSVWFGSIKWRTKLRQQQAWKLRETLEGECWRRGDLYSVYIFCPSSRKPWPRCKEQTQNSSVKYNADWLKAWAAADCKAVFTLHPTELLACWEEKTNTSWMNRTTPWVSTTSLGQMWPILKRKKTKNANSNSRCWTYQTQR